MYLSSSNILTAANKNSTGDKKRTDSSMEEFTSELEAITLASSAVSLLIDQFIHKNVSCIQSKPFMQYCLTAVESVGIAALISSLFGKETKGITQDTTACIKDIIFATLSSFDKTVHISALSLVALRAITLKFINDQGIYVDELTDIKEIYRCKYRYNWRGKD